VGKSPSVGKDIDITMVAVLLAVLLRCPADEVFVKLEIVGKFPRHFSKVPADP
jgi:hypothetical protein